jgi:hypothetical protein
VVLFIVSRVKRARARKRSLALGGAGGRAASLKST